MPFRLVDIAVIEALKNVFMTQIGSRRLKKLAYIAPFRNFAAVTESYQSEKKDTHRQSPE